MLLAHQTSFGMQQTNELSGWEESVMMTEEYNSHINAIRITNNRSLSKKQPVLRKRADNKENEQFVNRLSLNRYNKNGYAKQDSKAKRFSSICQLREEVKNINKFKGRWQGKECTVPGKYRPKSGYINPPAKMQEKKDVDCTQIIKSINTCRLIRKRPAIVHKENEFLAVFSTSINERPKSIHNKSRNRPQSSKQSKPSQTQTVGFTINQIDSDKVKEILKILGAS